MCGSFEVIPGCEIASQQTNSSETETMVHYFTAQPLTTGILLSEAAES